MYVKIVWSTKEDDPGRVEMLETKMFQVHWGERKIEKHDGTIVEISGYCGKLMVMTIGDGSQFVLLEGDAAYVLNQRGVTIDTFRP